MCRDYITIKAKFKIPHEKLRNQLDLIIFVAQMCVCLCVLPLTELII